MKFPSEFVVFDTETTGLNPTHGDRIVEIAAIKIRDYEPIQTFESFVNPQRPIPEDAIAIHNITEAMVADAPKHDTVLPDFLQFIGGASLVGHNIKFDLDFLCYELSLINRRLNDYTPGLDTLKMARRLMPHLGSYQLSNVAGSFGIKVDETHRALADVDLTVKVFVNLLRMAEKQGLGHPDDIYKNFSVTKPKFKIEQPEESFLF